MYLRQGLHRAARCARAASNARAFLLVLVAGTATLAGLLTPGTALAVSCSSSGVTVAPLHGTRFYTDSSSSLSSGYTGVSVASSTARANVWVGVSGFTGGVLGLNANQPSAIPLGDVAANTAVPAYFFMTASPMTDSAIAQNFTVTLYQGDPAHGGTTLCSYADGYSKGIYDTIKAAANKVKDVTGDTIAASVSTSSPVIGGTIVLTVEGTTGTLGNGPDGTPFIYETPTTLPSWPAGAFRLVGTTLTLSPGTAGAATYTNQLEISNAAWSAAQDYIASYTFRITGTTSTSTSAYPIQEISSGTQVKHTDPGSFAASIPAIPPATNPLTLTQSASTTTLPVSGGAVNYTLTLASSSTTSSTVDQLVDTMPAGASYVAGSTKLNGTTVADPTASGSTLVFPGPFAVSSSSSAVVTYRLTLPGTTGTYVNSALGYVASTTIDTTTDTSDSAPATATVAVGAPAPQAQTITFPQPADTRVDQGPVALGATASSGLAVAYTSSTTSVCTVAGSSVTLVTTGICTITAAQPGNASYAAAVSSSRSFAVTAAPQAQSITFPQPADTREDLGPVTLTATASSSLTVSYTTSTSSVCALSGSSVTLLTTGTCTIAAHQAGNSSYNAAADVTRSFTVTAAPAAPLTQSITFAQPADIQEDQGPVTLTATATSGLTVTTTSSTPTICTISGTTVTLLATGTCTITADQAGNSTYSPAGSVSRSFQITAALGAPAQTQTTVTAPPAPTPDPAPAAPPVVTTPGSTPPPLTIPTAALAHTTAGKPGSAVLGGLSPTATVVLAPSPPIPGVAGATIVGSRIDVTPTTTFSGTVTIPILVQDGGQTVETTVTIAVRPAPATHVVARPVSAAATQIVWRPSASAQEYVVEIDGRVVCRTAGTSCRVPSLVRPGASVAVTALGHAETRSVLSAGTVSTRRPVLLSVVHFASGSAALDHVAKRILDATRATIRKYGFARATLKCNTDNAGALGYNVKLSRNRCKAVSRYLIRHSRIGAVSYQQNAYAYLRPFAPNTTRARMAANRRVEIWVK